MVVDVQCVGSEVGLDVIWANLCALAADES